MVRRFLFVIFKLTGNVVSNTCNLYLKYKIQLIRSLNSIWNTKYKYSNGNVFQIQNTFDHVLQIQKYNDLAYTPSSLAMLQAISADPNPPPRQRNFNIGGLGNDEFMLQ